MQNEVENEENERVDAKTDSEENDERNGDGEEGSEPGESCLKVGGTEEGCESRSYFGEEGRGGFWAGEDGVGLREKVDSGSVPSVYADGSPGSNLVLTSDGINDE